MTKSELIEALSKKENLTEITSYRDRQYCL